MDTTDIPTKFTVQPICAQLLPATDATDAQVS